MYTSHRRHHARELVPVRYARSLLRVAEEQGYNLGELSRSLDLPSEIFSEAAQDQKIDARIYNRIYTRIMWLLQDESFGLQLKRGTPSGTFRMMCLCIIHCETLDAALHRAHEFNSFCRSLSGMKVTLKRPIRRIGEGRARYRFPQTSELIEERGEVDTYVIAHCIAIWRRFCGWLIGKPMELKAVYVQAPAPENGDYFEPLFGCPVHFNAEHNEFEIAEHYLDCPLIHTEESLNQFLKNAPYLLLINSEDQDASLIAQMKRFVGNDLSREFPSVVAMAEHLNMSVRTLRRRLKDHDTTYQQFKDNLRKEQAIRWLNQPELKINAVSALLGFDEPSAFHRSFKKWTGMTPGEYRASAQQGKKDV